MGFYLGVNRVVHGFCKWVLSRALYGPKKVSKWIQNCAIVGFYTGWNRVVPGPKKGSKWFEKFCANQVLYGCQAGSKKDIKGFYLDFMRDLKFFRVYGLKRVLRGEIHVKI